MGELDLREKKLLSKNDVFAAFLNAFVIDRDEVPISADELSEASPELISMMHRHVNHQFRDVIKCLQDDVGIKIALFGLENQTRRAKDMPIRIMSYDAFGYKELSKQAKSGEKLIPIITVVLYFGYDKPWTAPRSLSECCDVPKRLKRWFVDYPIHIVELGWLTDEEIERLEGDLKMIALCLRHFRDPKRWPFPTVKVKHVEEVLGLLGKITGDDIFEKLCDEYQATEEFDMGSKLESYREFYRTEGEKRGLALGGERGKIDQLALMTRRIMSKLNKTLEDAMSYLQLDDGEKSLVRRAMA